MRADLPLGLGKVLLDLDADGVVNVLAPGRLSDYPRKRWNMTPLLNSGSRLIWDPLAQSSSAGTPACSLLVQSSFATCWKQWPDIHMRCLVLFAYIEA